MKGSDRLLADVRRGLLAVVVLWLLYREDDMHGYAIRRRIFVLTGWEPPESTLYDVLKRLERLKLAESYWARGRQTGSLRKYYRLTSEGREALTAALSELGKLACGIACQGEV